MRSLWYDKTLFTSAYGFGCLFDWPSCANEHVSRKVWLWIERFLTYICIYAFILTLWRKAVEPPQTVRTKSRTRHSNLCKHGKYFFRSGSMYFLDRRYVAHGPCAQKISKKGHGSKKESFIDCSFNSASLARHKNKKNKKNKDKNYLTTMLPHSEQTKRQSHSKSVKIVKAIAPLDLQLHTTG